MLLKMTLMLCGILIKTDYKQLNRFVMKTKLLIIAGLIGVCCLISCKKKVWTIMAIPMWMETRQRTLCLNWKK